MGIGCSPFKMRWRVGVYMQMHLFIIIAAAATFAKYGYYF
jgi:hypothetical protein